MATGNNPAGQNKNVPPGHAPGTPRTPIPVAPQPRNPNQK